MKPSIEQNVMILIIYIYNKHNFLFEIPTSDNPPNKKSKYQKERTVPQNCNVYFRFLVAVGLEISCNPVTRKKFSIRKTYIIFTIPLFGGMY